MEMEKVLEKNRTMHHLMQKATVDALDFQHATEELRSVLQCSVYIMNQGWLHESSSPPPKLRHILQAIVLPQKILPAPCRKSTYLAVASKLAEEYKLTRSVIVNALRKLESAGVIDYLAVPTDSQ